MAKGLNRFENRVLFEAEEEKNRLISEVSEILKEKVSAVEMELLSKSYDSIKSEVSNSHRLRQKAISEANFVIKRALIKRREQMIDEIFETLKAKFCDFMKSEEYLPWITAHIELTKSFSNGKDMVLYFNSDDKERLSEALSSYSLIANDTITGGFKVLIEERHMLLDYTLDRRLLDSRAEFTGLIIAP